MIKNLENELLKKADKKRAENLQRFFKTGKGEYGEGDIFLGICVPELREISKRFLELTLNELRELLNTKIHEKRLIALFILVKKFEKAGEEEREEIFNFYLNNTKNINNWDLVDLSAPKIVGKFLFDKDRSILYKLSKSGNLWERRIAVLSSFEFIRLADFEDCLKISKVLISDKHDLIQKAVGWMLREIGKRDISVLKEFLRENYKIMPRTMLRYSIEKFPEEERKNYLKK